MTSIPLEPILSIRKVFINICNMKLRSGLKVIIEYWKVLWLLSTPELILSYAASTHKHLECEMNERLRSKGGKVK